MLPVHCYDTPLTDGCYAVTEIHDLIEFEGDQQDCPALSPLLYDALANILDGPYIQTTGRFATTRTFGDREISLATITFC